MPTTTLHVVQVFVDRDGAHGNALGVVLAGGDVPAARRQEVAADLGFSETVFVDELATGELRIFTPTLELPLAGHPLVGTAWLLARTGHALPALRPPAGVVPVTVDADGTTWITADPSDAPPWQPVELPSPAAVEGLDGDPTESGAGLAWAWLDRQAGRVRSRVFGARFGVAEDPATGSAALVLAAHVGRDLTIVQGTGSVLEARLAEQGQVRVGGRSRLVGRRELVLGPYAAP